MTTSNTSPITDELTGLLTRPAFLEKFEEAARTSGSMVLVFMDLDHLLEFNEKYGHVAGDQWIQGCAALFNEAFAQNSSVADSPIAGALGTPGDSSEPTAIVARYGGDEFVAAVKSYDFYKVFEKAEELRRRVDEDAPPVIVDGETIHPPYTISLGLAEYPAHASNIIELIEKGKEATLRAKQSGGNRVTFYRESDPLTGVLNFYASQRSLEEALGRARKNRESLAVLLLDIDRFKEVNDTYGHRAGDEVLRRLAHILENNFKEGVVGRLSGDEFIVILPGERADSAFVLAEEVRRLVEDSEIQGRVGENPFTLRFRFTGGIAVYPGDGTERVDLLRKADEALYRAKQIGRNRICLPASSQMVTKTSHYTQIQLERLAAMAQRLDRTEAFLLREALDDLLRKYGERE